MYDWFGFHHITSSMRERIDNIQNRLKENIVLQTEKEEFTNGKISSSLFSEAFVSSKENSKLYFSKIKKKDYHNMYDTKNIPLLSGFLFQILNNKLFYDTEYRFLLLNEIRKKSQSKYIVFKNNTTEIIFIDIDFYTYDNSIEFSSAMILLEEGKLLSNNRIPSVTVLSGNETDQSINYKLNEYYHVDESEKEKFLKDVFIKNIDRNEYNHNIKNTNGVETEISKEEIPLLVKTELTENKNSGIKKIKNYMICSHIGKLSNLKKIRLFSIVDVNKINKSFLLKYSLDGDFVRIFEKKIPKNKVFTCSVLSYKNPVLPEMMYTKNNEEVFSFELDNFVYDFSKNQSFFIEKIAKYIKNNNQLNKFLLTVVWNMVL